MEKKKKGPFSFFAVRRGHVPGIYTDWNKTCQQVDGFKHNSYEGFHSYEEALNSMKSVGIHEPLFFGPITSSTTCIDTQNQIPQVETITNESKSNHNLSTEVSNIDIEIASNPNLESESTSEIDYEITLKKTIFHCDDDRPSHVISTKLDPLCNVSTQTDMSSECKDESPKTPEITAKYSDACTQTVMFSNQINDLINRLNDKTALFDQLSNEINLVKIQLKNEIKSYFDCSDSNIERIEKTLSEIQSNNSKISSQNSDTRFNWKEFSKTQKKNDEKNSEIQSQLDILQNEVKLLTSEMSKLHDKFDESTLNNQTEQIDSPDITTETKMTCSSQKEVLTSHNQQYSNIDKSTSDHDTSPLYSHAETPVTPQDSRTSLPDPDKPTPNQSPRDKLISINLDDDDLKKADQILIGDSQVKYINPTKMFKDRSPNAQQYSKRICIPGITAYDVFYWLRTQNIQQGVKLVVIHVGINRCMRGNTILEDHWSRLITQAKKIFPDAHITMSSMIPVGSRHKLHQVIMTSIDYLKTACSKLDVSFADNTSLFLSRSWAPRCDLLADPFHPNLQGSIKLSLNMRYHALFKREKNYSENNNHYNGYKNDMYTNCDYSYENISSMDINIEGDDIVEENGPSTRQRTDIHEQASGRFYAKETYNLLKGKFKQVISFFQSINS